MTLRTNFTMYLKWFINDSSKLNINLQFILNFLVRFISDVYALLNFTVRIFYI